MKSKKARRFINDRLFIGSLTFIAADVEYCVTCAEQEAEERMRTKAMEVFCAANCPKGCSFGADGNIGCGAKARFIQKLNE